MVVVHKDFGVLSSPRRKIVSLTSKFSRRHLGPNFKTLFLEDRAGGPRSLHVNLNWNYLKIVVVVHKDFGVLSSPRRKIVSQTSKFSRRHLGPNFKTLFLEDRAGGPRSLHVNLNSTNFTQTKFSSPFYLQIFSLINFI